MLWSSSSLSPTSLPELGTATSVMRDETIIGYCVHCGRPIRAGDPFWATTRGPYCSTECMDQADRGEGPVPVAVLRDAERRDETIIVDVDYCVYCGCPIRFGDTSWTHGCSQRSRSTLPSSTKGRSWGDHNY